jgi:hypothetical protein
MGRYAVDEDWRQEGNEAGCDGINGKVGLTKGKQRKGKGWKRWREGTLTRA